MKRQLAYGAVVLGLVLGVSAATPTLVSQPTEEVEPSAPAAELTLLTATPEEGFQLAIRLSRLGVTETQTDREVLHALRESYAHDADALMAASQVIAIHFQTIAAANDYWR